MHAHLSEKGLITFAVIVACTSLLLAGKDHVVAWSLLGVVCGYYGIELGPVHWIRKHNGGK